VNWGFEYRPLPSFICTPAITLCVFTLASVVVEFCKSVRYDEAAVMSTYPSEQLSSNEFDGCNKIRVMLGWKKRWDCIKRLPGYEENEDTLKAFYWMLKHGALFSQMPDMKQAWGIEVPAPAQLMTTDEAWRICQ
jgi:hypothetical protein